MIQLISYCFSRKTGQICFGAVAGPKIKIPEALKKYRNHKKLLENQHNIDGFPTIQKVYERIKSASLSPEKKRPIEVIFNPYSVFESHEACKKMKIRKKNTSMF